jgi:hemerythrin superfamily protein
MQQNNAQEVPGHRSIADQGVDELGGARSVLVRQRRDHARLDALLERCLRATGEEQQEVLHRTWRLAFTHAFAEEAVLWPAIRRVHPDGDALTLRVEQEHQQINQLVTELQRTQAGEQGRAELLGRVVALLRQDVRDEEDVVLPALQAALDPRALRRLGIAWELVRRTAPTRPHPVVARRPPGNMLSALPLTLLDRSRDVLDRAARSAPDPVARVSRAASRSLATAAGTIERLPPLQYGEDRSTRPVPSGAEH